MIRNRYRKRSVGDEISALNANEEDDRGYQENHKMFSSAHFHGNLFFIISLFAIVYLLDYNLTTPLMIEDESSNPGQFIAERAKLHVTQLASLGPRPVGSLANEVLAVQYLSKTLSSIQAHSSSLAVEVDKQIVDGEFPLQFLDGLTSVYRNIQNVVVKVRSGSSTGKAILLNCHYDSVVDSPGASDDLAACGVLLEVLRVITTSNHSIQHDLIFLFNGAEENILQGSHGFITQHKWAKNIIAVINMDACGVGGREMLFQVGPHNSWLIKAYADSVPRPAASITAQEVFQRGLIPGDTDYRIFRDFGKIPGFDFAWAMGGYTYHTKLDSADYVTLSSLQATGENILPLTLRMANLRCPEECETTEDSVFFDLLHVYLLRLPKVHAFIISGFYILLSIVLWNWSTNRKSLTSQLPKKKWATLTIRAAVFLVISWIFVLTFNIGTAISFYFLGRAMSWFSRPAWIYFLYGIPAVAIPLSVLIKLTTHMRERMLTSFSWPLVNIFADALQLILTVVVALGLLLNIGSVFLVTLSAILFSVANLLKIYLPPNRFGNKWLLAYIIFITLPSLMMWYVAHVLFKTIIPIMGRAGAGYKGEVVIAVLTSLITISITYPILPTVFMCRNNWNVVKNLSIVYIISVLVLIFTPLSFPYSSSPQSPSSQRYTIIHSHRAYHGISKADFQEQSGFWVVDLDAHSPHSVKSFVPEIGIAMPVDDCPHKLYCGLPYLIPVFNIFKETHWIPGPKPTIYIPANLTLTKSVKLDGNIVALDIKAEGPDHMRIMISPVPGVELASWSFANGYVPPGADWGERKSYFIYYSYASYPGPLTFTLYLKTTARDVKLHPHLIDIAVSGHFIHGPFQKSVPLTKILAQFPPWTVTSGWVATYTSYKF